MFVYTNFNIDLNSFKNQNNIICNKIMNALIKFNKKIEFIKFCSIIENYQAICPIIPDNLQEQLEYLTQFNEHIHKKARKGVCLTCLDENTDYKYFVDCCHSFCLCNNCCSKIEKCPACRKIITQKKNIYIID
jgi:hypothetical protein